MNLPLADCQAFQADFHVHVPKALLGMNPRSRLPVQCDDLYRQHFGGKHHLVIPWQLHAELEPNQEGRCSNQHNEVGSFASLWAM